MKGNKDKKKSMESNGTSPKETNEVQNIEKPDTQQILDRLNIQLLISVTLYSVGYWVYLNGKICSFTGFEPLGEQLSYIFVHYILTAVLLLCVSLTAIKSYFMLKTDQRFKDWLIKLFKFFLETWYWILGLSFFVILCSGAFEWEWLFGAIVLLSFFYLKMKDVGFKIKYILGTLITLIILFPVFISSMTLIISNVEIKNDKPFYSFSEKVYITVSARGYSCNHKLVGLGEQYKDVKFYYDKGLIVLNATQIKNNEIAIATITPATGLTQFLSYPFDKILGKEIRYMEISPNNIDSIKNYANFTPHNIYVKP